MKLWNQINLRTLKLLMLKRLRYLSVTVFGPSLLTVTIFGQTLHTFTLPFLTVTHRY